MSLGLVVAYAPRHDDDRARWLAPIIAALLGCLGLLLSSDRLLLGLVSVAAMAGYEALARRRRGQSARPALARLGRFALAEGVALAVLAGAARLWGAHPLDYLAGQRRLVAAYGANLALPWDADVVSRSAMAALLALAAGLALVLAWRRSAPWARGAWLLGALPFSAFALIHADSGHVFVAVMPIVATLSLLALSAASAAPTFVRTGAGLVAAVFLLGWFGKRPAQVWTRPAALLEARRAWLGIDQPDPTYSTDVSIATQYVESHGDACIGVRAGLTAVHALADRGGPTLMALRWNTALQEQLAERMRKDRCPLFVYEMYSFDIPHSAWFLGEDFLALAELYEPRQALGPSMVGMSLRAKPRPAKREPIALRGAPASGAVSLPSELTLQLDRPVDGSHVLSLDYTLSLASWRVLSGGTPIIKWRFERGGVPLGDWQYLFHLRVGERTRAYLSPEPEVTERRWIAGDPMRPTAQATELSLRFERRGLSSPSSVGFTLHGAELLSPGEEPEPRGATSCRASEDLRAQLESGRAWARNVSPRLDAYSFQLHPNAKNEPQAEVFFPIRPCADSCFSAKLGLDAAYPPGDGAAFEVHVIDRGARPLLDKRFVAQDASTEIELPLGHWHDRDVLLRIGSHSRETTHGDFAWVSGPRIGHCSARTSLARALAEDRAFTNYGYSEPRDDDILVDRRGVEVRYPFRVIEGTCVSLGYALAKGHQAKGSMDVYLDVVVDGLRNRLYESRISPDTPRRDRVLSVNDWRGRQVDLVLGAHPVAGRGDFAAFVAPRLHACGKP